jgi:hypothetical protein
MARMSGVLQPGAQSPFELLRAGEVDPWTNSRVEAFVVAHPHGTIYHHPVSLQLLEKECDQESSLKADRFADRLADVA